MRSMLSSLSYFSIRCSVCSSRLSDPWGIQCLNHSCLCYEAVQYRHQHSRPMSALSTSFRTCRNIGKTYGFHKYSTWLSFKNEQFKRLNLHHQTYSNRGKSSSNNRKSDDQWRIPEISLTSLFGIGLLACSSSDGNNKEGSANCRRFIAAVKDGDVRSLRNLLKKGVDVNCRHPLGWSALHTAVINGDFGMTEFLIENGADVDMKDEFSAANRIASQKRLSSLRVVQIRDQEFSPVINHFVSYSGFTPLHYAVVVNDERLVKCLLERGADPTLENNIGYIPIDYSTNKRIKQLLMEYATKYEERKLKEKLEERRRYPLEERLRQNIVGQEGAITAAASAIRRKEMGWEDDEHPMVFLFLGSSGIGKTELAKQIAKYIHKDKKEGFIRLDMSEYQEKHEVAKLIGAPPGYIGHDQGGQLTKQLAKCPNAVVLFDEVDKAHPDVLTVLLQLFDEGRLTDGKGKTISCKDALFVMTSNLASDEIALHGLQLRKEAQLAAEKFRESDEEQKQKEHIEISREFKEHVVEPILKRHFKRDEFLGRINEMLYFLPFSRSELNHLVERQLVIWKERTMKRHSIDLTWEKEVLDVLADGYKVKYGARSIQHEVERVAITLLADSFSQGTISKGNKVTLTVDSEAEDQRPVISLRVSDDDDESASPHPDLVGVGSFGMGNSI